MMAARFSRNSIDVIAVAIMKTPAKNTAAFFANKERHIIDAIPRILSEWSRLLSDNDRKAKMTSHTNARAPINSVKSFGLGKFMISRSPSATMEYSHASSARWCRDRSPAERAVNHSLIGGESHER